jgi:hypothetical protein
MTYCLAVEQALDDVSLPPAARLTKWHIRKRLTMVAFTEVKAESLANEMRVLDTTVGKMLTLLVERGYLEESGKKKPRAFRLPWSRRAYTERAA